MVPLALLARKMIGTGSSITLARASVGPSLRRSRPGAPLRRVSSIKLWMSWPSISAIGLSFQRSHRPPLIRNSRVDCDSDHHRGDLDRDDRVVISALVRDNECGGERRNHTPLADWCPHGKSVSLPLAGAR